MTHLSHRNSDRPFGPLFFLCVFSVSLCLCGSKLWAESPARLKVFPAKVDLHGQDDRQSIVVQHVDSQGVTRDVTASAKLRLTDASLASVANQTLAPKKDGSTQLIV